ncbi:MAG: F(420)H(2) dehydrogenase subunit L [Methanomassiliicoccales archaeon PtaU1.Bin124]|nr:MAG: F(420)H(2) dehydrogenase subunit L [Methanomassiliicoccales archaeon PtaU1.Bin124]
MDYTGLFELAWIIPILPIISFLIVGFLGQKIKGRGGIIAVGLVAAAMVLSLTIAYAALTGGLPEQGYFEQSFNWVVLGSDFTIQMGIYIDAVTALMLIVVSFVATLVVIYSLGYMHDEGDRRRRYFTEISLFVGVMLGLVLANNFLELFIFWELVGLCSYLLIGFWFEKPSAASAAKKAFLVTRVGDVMFLIGLVIIFNLFHSTSYSTIFSPEEIAGVDQTWLMWGVFFMFGGAIGKSAQFPLHDWLPDAMEGPTTVSALIHAATMVKAGVYLVARMFPLLVHAENVMLLIAVIGGVTAFMAATMALNSPNIKRVLAYSTISQLGYMFLALGAGGYMFALGLEEGNEELMVAGSLGFAAGMFHLMNHAFFKALLFLSAGSVIHYVHTEEMAKMGGLRKHMKVTSLVMLIGSLSIAGIVPLSGFWSKDLILETVWEGRLDSIIFLGLYVLAVLTAFMTAFYMFRMWFLTFAGEEGEATKHAAAHHDEHHVDSHGSDEHDHKESHGHHEAPWVMLAPLIVLAILAIGSGFALFIGSGFTSVIYFEIPYTHDAGYWLEKFFWGESSFLTYISLAAAVLGIALAYFTFYKKRVDAPAIASKPAVKPLYNMLLKRYGFTKGYDYVGEKIVYGFSLALDWFDRKIIDGLVNGFSKLIQRSGAGLRRAQTGFVQTYAGVVAGGAVAMMLLLFFLLKLLGIEVHP